MGEWVCKRMGVWWVGWREEGCLLSRWVDERVDV